MSPTRNGVQVLFGGEVEPWRIRRYLESYESKIWIGESDEEGFGRVLRCRDVPEAALFDLFSALEHGVPCLGPPHMTWAVDVHTRPGGERSPVGELVYAAKYQGSGHAEEHLEEHLFSFARQSGLYSGADVITYVPASAASSNHLPQRLAERLAKRMRVPCRALLTHTGAVTDTKHAEPQAVRAALAAAIRPAGAIPDRVILIDDLFRSGNTIQASMEALRRANDGCQPRALVGTITRTAKGLAAPIPPDEVPF